MATRQDYEQVKAYARIDGAVVGCMWIASFACFVGNFRHPMLGLLALVLGAVSIVWAAMRLRRFRDEILDGAISFRRAFCYSMFTYLYAALIMALGQYVYLQFMDGGFLMSQYSEMVSRPEFSAAIGTLYGMKDDDVRLAMDTLGGLRPIEFALQFFTMDVLLGLVVSLPMACIVRTRGRVRH